MPNRPTYQQRNTSDDNEKLFADLKPEWQDEIERQTATILRNSEIMAKKRGHKSAITEAGARAVALAMMAKTEFESLR